MAQNDPEDFPKLVAVDRAIREMYEQTDRLQEVRLWITLVESTSQVILAESISASHLTEMASPMVRKMMLKGLRDSKDQLEQEIKDLKQHIEDSLNREPKLEGLSNDE